MGLATYRRKRRFDKTPEPAGGAPKKKGGASFCVQKHAATRLHYDFRLEMEGVLRSWAVPKGPSLDPAEKRLAAHVEDHPIEYGSFEGIIPKGQYGGGTVVLWDRGTWKPEGDPIRAYRAGKIKFELFGEKLKGGWTLVKMHGPRNADGKSWLLIKEKDDESRPGHGSRLVDERPESVATGRTLDEVAAAKDRVHQSKPRARAKPRTVSAEIDPSAIDGAKRAALPATIAPQLATLVDAAPTGDAWLHEIKFDGYRLLARTQGGRARLLTRGGKDWTDKFRPLADALAALPVKDAFLDGEAVVLRGNGTSDFQALQNALSEGRSEEIVYFAFDLLHLDGRDLRGAPLVARKQALAALLASADADGPLRYSDHVVGGGDAFFQHACRMSVEGAIAKRADRPYVSGRGDDWLKVKCLKGQEVVIVGFTEPSGSREGLGALLVGVNEDGGLRFAGKVGTGFTQRSLVDLRKKLGALETSKPPVVDPPTGADARGAHWVKPTLVAEVSFTEWTRDGRLRHPSFKGLRTDKPAKAIVRERERHAPREAARIAAARTANTRRRVARVASALASAVESTAAFDALTHPDRVLWPGQRVTKIELARHYEAVADWMLPHVAGRPLTLVRCPQGQGSKCFFQKHAGDSTPKEVRRIPFPLDEGKNEGPYMEIDSLAGLVALVQMGVLEVHVWGSRTADVEHPDRIVMDLDPDPSVAWSDVVEAAIELRGRFDDLGLASFVKTTGGKGLHVVVPIRGKTTWAEAKAFAHSLADAMERDAPDRYVANMSKAKRVGRIFVDYLRNGRGATAVAPYSSRARPDAPVATPLAWEELTPKLKPSAFTVRTLAGRVVALRVDPWRDMAETRQSLAAAAKKLDVATR